MRMFLLCVLLFLPLTVNANCSDYHGQADECKDTEGCYYKANSGECILCPSNSNANSTGYYCPQNGICADGEPSDSGRCQCPTPFNLSTLGTTKVGDCYTPCAATSDNYDSYTKDCGLTYLGYYNGNEVSCKQNGIITYDQNDADYHAEPLSGNTYGCYFKSRPCSAFNTTNCSGNIFGPAIWQRYEWDVNNCECRQEEFTDTTNFCYGRQNKKPSTSTISGVNIPINYNTQFRYWCVSCFPGHYVKSDDILAAGGANQTCIVGEDGGGAHAVCKCTPAPQGTWIDSCNITYPITNPNNPICSTTDCPAGKTTDGAGAQSLNDCNYTNQTKFCDANGCFNITDAPDWSWGL